MYWIVLLQELQVSVKLLGKGDVYVLGCVLVVFLGIFVIVWSERFFELGRISDFFWGITYAIFL